MKHEEEKGKLKEIKWQRGKGVQWRRKAEEEQRKRKGKKRSEQRYGKGSMLF